MPEPLSDNTRGLRAGEAVYFTRVRGMSEAAVAELLAVSVAELQSLLARRTGNPAGYIPTPDEIAAECERLRPGKQIGNESANRSPAAILSRMVPAGALNDGRDMDREAA